MAPTQSRHLLIWSIPSLALLFGFLWYKRRKGSLRIDPGGTKTKKIVKILQIDDNPNSDKKISTKTSIEATKKSVYMSSDDEYTVDDLKFSDKYKKCNIESKKSDAKFKSDIGSVDLNKTSTPKNKYFGEITDIINISDDSLVDLTVSPIKEPDIGSIDTDLSNSENEIKIIGIIKTKGEVINTDKIEGSDSDPDVKEKESFITDFKFISKKETGGVKSSTDTSVTKRTIKTEGNNSNLCLQSKIVDKQADAIGTVGHVINGEISTTVMAEESNGCIGDEGIEKNILTVPVDQEKIVEPAVFSCTKEEEDNNTNSVSNNIEGLQDNKMAHNKGGTIQEQKLVTLGQAIERDSANHSPAEVMLASPSISNYSDEHSEGSSDSGKGCSDVATPAGGSSVAGDQIPCVYEFVLEQQLVGRLIGRHGSYLHDIRTKTHTNIFIKRHPETSKLKICAIEGTQQDIDTALAMIRQKFPLRRFPTLTLEKVSFVPTIPLCPLRPEAFHLQLVEGVNNDVLLSSLISAAHFFLQQPMHPSYQSLSTLNHMMTNVYNSPEAPALTTPVVDAICAAPTMGGWYRAQVVSVNEKSQSCDVKFVDYGGYLIMDTSSLRQIRADFLMLPFQAIECYLANVVPAGGEGAEWSEEARQYVQCLTQQQLLQAQVYSYTDTGIPLVYLYATQCTQNGIEVVLINQELVARGYADMLMVPEE